MEILDSDITIKDLVWELLGKGYNTDYYRLLKEFVEDGFFINNHFFFDVSKEILDKGYIKIVDSNGEVGPNSVVRITPKGVEFFINYYIDKMKRKDELFWKEALK